MKVTRGNCEDGVGGLNCHPQVSTQNLSNLCTLNISIITNSYRDITICTPARNRIKICLSFYPQKLKSSLRYCLLIKQFLSWFFRIVANSPRKCFVDHQLIVLFFSLPDFSVSSFLFIGITSYSAVPVKDFFEPCYATSRNSIIIIVFLSLFIDNLISFGNL